MDGVLPVVDVTKARAIPGWMARRELRWLAAHALTSQTVIEIGASRGRSTRALGDHVQGCVYSIDPWADVPEYPVGYGDRTFAACQAGLADLIDAGRVVLIRKTSAEAVQRFDGMSVDLVFIDGDHSYDGCRSDIALYRPLLRRGGILAGHDYNTKPKHAGVRQAVDEACPSVELVGSIWWTAA